MSPSITWDSYEPYCLFPVIYALVDLFISVCTQEGLLRALGCNPIQLPFLAQIPPALSTGSSFTGSRVPLLQAHPVHVLSPVLETATSPREPGLAFCFVS